MSLLRAAEDVSRAIWHALTPHCYPTEWCPLNYEEPSDEMKELEARSYCPHGHLLAHYHGAEPGDRCYRLPYFPDEIEAAARVQA